MVKFLFICTAVVLLGLMEALHKMTAQKLHICCLSKGFFVLLMPFDQKYVLGLAIRSDLVKNIKAIISLIILNQMKVFLPHLSN